MVSCGFCKRFGELFCVNCDIKMCKKHVFKHLIENRPHLIEKIKLIDDRKRMLIKEQIKDLVKTRKIIENITTEIIKDIQGYAKEILNNLDNYKKDLEMLAQEIQINKQVKTKLRKIKWRKINTFEKPDLEEIRKLYKKNLFVDQRRITEKDWEIFFSNYSDRISQATLSRDFKYLACGSSDFCVRVWELNDWKLKKVLLGHNREVTCVLFSYDCLSIYSGSNDCFIKKWGLITGKLENEWKDHSSGIVSLFIDQKNGVFLSLDKSGLMILRKQPGMEIIKKLNFGLGVQKIVQYPNREIIIIFNENFYMFFYYLKIKRKQIDSKNISALALTNTTEKIVIGTKTSLIILYTLSNFSQESTLKGHSSPIEILAITNNDYFLISSDDSQVIVWDLRSLEPFKNLRLSNCSSILTTHDSEFCFISFSNKIGKLNLNNPDFKINTQFQAVNSRFLIVSKSLKLLVFISQNYGSVVWKLRTRSEDFVMKGHTQTTCIALSECDHFALTGGEDSKLIFWDIFKKQKISTLSGHSQKIQSVAFSKTGKLACSSSIDGSIITWDLDKFSVLTKRILSNPLVHCLSFSHNEEELLVSTADQAIFVWKIRENDLSSFGEFGNEYKYLSFLEENLLLIATCSYIQVINYKTKVLDTFYFSINQAEPLISSKKHLERTLRYFL